jgi:hypothetical protein
MFVVFPEYYCCNNHSDTEGLLAGDLRQVGEKRMAKRKEEGKRRKSR